MQSVDYNMKWTIIGDGEPYVVPSTGKKCTRVIAQCECGVIKLVHLTYIKTGRSKSCGCDKREKFKTINLKHNMSKSSEHIAWMSMIQRCTNPNNKQWKDYGGRGITVCDRWRYSYENFINDMGPKPSPDHSLDRFPNNDGIYEPNNCRWATSKEQANNRRTTKKI